MRTTSLVFVAAAAMLASAGAAAQQDSAKAPTTVKEVMTAMTVPASDAIFAAASEPPKDEAQWLALRKNAALLAESGRLLTTAAFAKDSTKWMDMAGALVEEADATLKLAEARNSEALEKTGDEVYATCEACHAQYLSPSN